jgi:hypothetical protein
VTAPIEQLALTIFVSACGFPTTTYFDGEYWIYFSGAGITDTNSVVEVTPDTLTCVIPVATILPNLPAKTYNGFGEWKGIVGTYIVVQTLPCDRPSTTQAQGYGSTPTYGSRLNKDMAFNLVVYR